MFLRLTKNSLFSVCTMIKDLSCQFLCNFATSTFQSCRAERCNSAKQNESACVRARACMWKWYSYILFMTSTIWSKFPEGIKFNPDVWVCCRCFKCHNHLDCIRFDEPTLMTKDCYLCTVEHRTSKTTQSFEQRDK